MCGGTKVTIFEPHRIPLVAPPTGKLAQVAGGSKL